MRENLLEPTMLYCDNTATMHIASNPIYHKRTKRIDNDCHIVRKNIQKKIIKIAYVLTPPQQADIFTKALENSQHDYLLGKLGTTNLYQA